MKEEPFVNHEKAERLKELCKQLHEDIIVIQNRMLKRMGKTWDSESFGSHPESQERLILIFKYARLYRRALILNGELQPMRFPRGIVREGIERFPRRKRGAES